MGKTITNKQIEQLWDDVLTPNEDAICALGIFENPVISSIKFPDLHFIVENVDIPNSDVTFHALCLDLNISGIGRTLQESIKTMAESIMGFIQKIPEEQRPKVLEEEMREHSLEKYWGAYRVWNLRLAQLGKSISHTRKKKWLDELMDIQADLKVAQLPEYQAAA